MLYNEPTNPLLVRRRTVCLSQRIGHALALALLAACPCLLTIASDSGRGRVDEHAG